MYNSREETHVISATTDKLEHEEEDLDYVLLTEMVRKQYMSYLNKQLRANVLAWESVRAKCNTPNALHGKLKEEDTICKCTKLLEDEAIKACMVTKLYQRAMIKIIATVCRSTKEQRLVEHLYEIAFSDNVCSNKTFCDKATQTVDTSNGYNRTTFDDKSAPMTLEQKINIFQERLNRESLVTDNNWLRREHASEQRYQRKRNYRQMSARRRDRHRNWNEARTEEGNVTPVTPPMEGHETEINEQIPLQQQEKEESKPQSPTKEEEEEDNISKELARLFSEEKTELDELFGIDPNDEPDDPQISSILREIEMAKLPTHEAPDDPQANTTSVQCKNNVEEILPQQARHKENESAQQKQIQSLHHSLWPCELYMQRRRLAGTLSRLIDEDFRWQDIIKWKFSTLFGEDSDDEFACYSPSIELDEVLINSCMRRISPWLVKYLMKPLDDGLIANSFLFKKLAKRLARVIIMENQYPDERVIKRAVGNFFCLHRSVMSIEDLNDIPQISFNDNGDLKFY